MACVYTLPGGAETVLLLPSWPLAQKSSLIILTSIAAVLRTMGTRIRDRSEGALLSNKAAYMPGFYFQDSSSRASEL